MKRENEHKEYCEQDILDQISRMSEDTEVPDSLRSENIDKLLANLRDAENRKASFVTCIALVTGSEEHVFYGEISGKIIRERRGSSGFGYDSVFVPEGYEETFAEMGEEEKNKGSIFGEFVGNTNDGFFTVFIITHH